uniref:Uncharacterized protein B16D18.070 n=1 Tax=Neurospora crassa TaxID=5141 RepID=Q6MVP9_NEUCS|nr:hypothetical protein [Neurospora crassa]
MNRTMRDKPKVFTSMVPPGSRGLTLQVTAEARLMSKCFKKYGYFRRAESSHCNSVCGAGSSDADKGSAPRCRSRTGSHSRVSTVHSLGSATSVYT